MNWKFKIIFLGSILVTTLLNDSYAQLNQVDSRGRKQGEWVKYYEDREYSDVIRYKGQFKNDKPIGKFVYYFPTRKVRAIIIHEENSSRSEAFFYHDNEEVAAHGIYRNGKKDSVWTNFTPNGYYSSQETFKNDLLNGPKTVFYGQEVTIDKRKLVLRVDNYKDGILEGQSIEYFPDGVIKFKGIYKDGVKNGKAMHYHPSGRPSIEEHWKAKKKHGLWRTFDENGKEIGRRYFKNGVSLEGEKLEKYLKELKEKGLTPNQ